jgi:hypothetical protein
MNSKDILNFKVNSLLNIRIGDSIDLYLELFNDISEILEDGSISIERRLCSKHLKTLINSDKSYYINPDGFEFPLKYLKRELEFINSFGDWFWFEDGISWCSTKSMRYNKCPCAQLTPDYIDLLEPLDIFGLFSFGYLDDGNNLFYSFHDKIPEIEKVLTLKLNYYF